MKLHIPQIGDILTVGKDWTFPLHYEYRNDTLRQYLGMEAFEWKNYHDDKTRPLPVEVTLKKGMELKLKRLYIRSGHYAKFNSLTFELVGATIPAWEEEVVMTYSGLRGAPNVSKLITVKHPKRRVSFWARLEDVNKLEIL